jgi:hypothetical protein
MHVVAADHDVTPGGNEHQRWCTLPPCANIVPPSGRQRSTGGTLNPIGGIDRRKFAYLGAVAPALGGAARRLQQFVGLISFFMSGCAVGRRVTLIRSVRKNLYIPALDGLRSLPNHGESQR